MKRLSRNNLEEIGRRVVRAYQKLPEVAGQPMYRMDLELLAEGLLGLRVEYRRLSRDGMVLGMTSFESIGIELAGDEEREEIYFLDGKTILIESKLREEPEQLGRRNFTIAHEVGHQVLKMLFPADYGVNAYQQPVHFCKANIVKNRPISDWEEWQSNVLGAALLLPQSLIEQAMDWVGLSSKIRVLNKLFARDDYERFVKMTKILGCSKTALAIRMKQFGYIEKDYLDNPYRMVEVEVDSHGEDEYTSG